MEQERRYFCLSIFPGCYPSRAVYVTKLSNVYQVHSGRKGEHNKRSALTADMQRQNSNCFHRIRLRPTLLQKIKIVANVIITRTQLIKRFSDIFLYWSSLKTLVQFIYETHRLSRRIKELTVPGFLGHIQDARKTTIKLCQLWTKPQTKEIVA